MVGLQVVLYIHVHCIEASSLRDPVTQTDILNTRMAQNEEIFEKCVSLCGLVFLLCQKAMKNVFYNVVALATSAWQMSFV